MDKKKNSKRSKNDSQTYAFLATFLSIVGFVIALVTKKEDKYVMFYARQSLIIFILMILGGIINSILSFIPVLGWFIAFIITLSIILIWIMSWVYALSGKEKRIPLVTDYADKIKI